MSENSKKAIAKDDGKPKSKLVVPYHGKGAKKLMKSLFEPSHYMQRSMSQSQHKT